MLWWTRRSQAGLLAVLVLAAILRAPRALLRWDEVSWQYAAYNAPAVDALLAGSPAALLNSFSGLHPPLYPSLHALVELAWPVPIVWLAGSVVFSWLAVVLVARRSVLAGLVLACGPLQLHYAAEVNNYPLMVLSLALVWVARQRAADGLGWGLLALAGVFAAWTHALGGFAAGVAALTLPRGVAVRVLAVMALGVTPLVGGVAELVGEPGTFRQPPVKLGLILGDAIDRFGLTWLAWVPAMLLGMRRRPAFAAGVLATWVMFAGLQVAGVAAPHQFPYYLALGVPLAFSIDAGAVGRHRFFVGAVAVSIGLNHLVGDLRAAQALHDDLGRERAIDRALEQASDGEAIYLLSPPGVADDDKRATSAVLWRLPPFSKMPVARPYSFAYDDDRHGQPRLVDGRVIYVQDWPRPELDLAVAAHPGVWIVVSAPGSRTAYTSELARRYGVPAIEIGEDFLFHVQR